MAIRFLGLTISPPNSGGFNNLSFAHYPGQGFNCFFKDGSVHYVESMNAFNFLVNFPAGQSLGMPDYNCIFDSLEADNNK